MVAKQVMMSRFDHVWKHSGVLLRVPIGQDVVVIGNGLVVVLGQGGPAQSPRVSELLLDGALCKRCKVCPSFSPRCDSSSELRYHFSHWPFYYNIHECINALLCDLLIFISIFPSEPGVG